MSKSPQTPAPASRVWTTPRLIRLGTIADVAGNQTAGPQSANSKS